MSDPDDRGVCEFFDNTCSSLAEPRSVRHCDDYVCSTITSKNNPATSKSRCQKLFFAFLALIDTCAALRLGPYSPILPCKISDAPPRAMRNLYKLQMRRCLITRRLLWHVVPVPVKLPLCLGR